MRTKSGFTSGMSEPAWLRMNATANRGSMPPEQPAKIEIVPVGATVVRLQLRSARSGRTREPSSRVAAFPSGPQIERSHAGKTPRRLGELLRRDARLLVDELHDAAAHLHALVGVVGDAEAHEHVRPPHHAEADAADGLGQLVDLLEGIAVRVDDVVEEVRRQVDDLAQRLPVHGLVGVVARARRPPSRTCPRLMLPRLHTS